MAGTGRSNRRRMIGCQSVPHSAGTLDSGDGRTGLEFHRMPALAPAPTRDSIRAGKYAAIAVRHKYSKSAPRTHGPAPLEAARLARPVSRIEVVAARAVFAEAHANA